MKDPSEKERKLLEQHKGIFKEKLDLSVKDLFKFCKFFKIIRYIIEETDNLKTD